MELSLHSWTKRWKELRGTIQIFIFKQDSCFKTYLFLLLFLLPNHTSCSRWSEKVRLRNESSQTKEKNCWKSGQCSFVGNTWMRRFDLVLFFVRKSWLIIITLGSPNWTCDRLHFSCIACSTHKHGGEKSWTKLLWHGKLFKVSRGKMNPRSFKDKFEKMRALEEILVIKYVWGNSPFCTCGNPNMAFWMLCHWREKATKLFLRWWWRGLTLIVSVSRYIPPNLNTTCCILNDQ